MANPHLQMRIWKLDKPMAELARNSDGDQLLFVHEGEGALFCDYGHLDYRDGDYLVIPRGTMWRLSPTKPTTSLMVEATNDHFTLPEKGLVGRHAIFDPAILDTAQDRRRLPRPAGRAHLEGVGEAAQPALDRDLPVQPAGRGGLAWRLERRAHQLARPATADEPSRPPAALGPHHLRGRPFRRLHLRAAAARERSGGAAPAVLPQQRRFRRGHLLSQGQLLQPRQHPSRYDDRAPLGLHARPHPKAFQRRDKGGKTETDEVAVMIDTRDAVDVAAMPAGVEFDGYVKSWRPPEIKQAAE